MDETGRQHYLDATVAYKRAVLNCIKYLANFGYTEEQVIPTTPGAFFLGGVPGVVGVRGQGGGSGFRSGRDCLIFAIQGHLAHKKPPFFP